MPVPPPCPSLCEGLSPASEGQRESDQQLLGMPSLAGWAAQTGLLSAFCHCASSRQSHSLSPWHGDSTAGRCCPEDWQCWQLQDACTSALIILGNSLVFLSGGGDPAWEHSWLCWFTDASASPGEARQGQADRGLCCCLLLTVSVKIVDFLTISPCGKICWGWFFWGVGRAACMYTLEPPQKCQQVGMSVKCLIATFCNFSIRRDLNKILF